MNPDLSQLAPHTRLIAGGRSPEWSGGAVSPPVTRASTHLFPDVQSLRAARISDDAGWFYGRRGGPPQWALAEALTALEPGAAGTLLFPSGMAAVAVALLAVLEPGDTLWMTDNAYEPSRIFADGELKRRGVTTRYFDPSEGAALAERFDERARAILLESPGSLSFEVADVPAIAAAAKARGMAVLLDNSWATPLLFPALGHGVDVAILACTKYVVGHSDVLLGSATSTAAYHPRLRDTAIQLGQMCSPDDAWLALRGLRTMGVRLNHQGASGIEIARWLERQPRVARVLHPALPGCPGHALWQRDFRGASGLFAIELDSDEAGATRFVDALALFGIGYSWGGFESLAVPASPARCRSVTDWSGRGPLVRLHIGLEDRADLIADLDQALAQL